MRCFLTPKRFASNADISGYVPKSISDNKFLKTLSTYLTSASYIHVKHRNIEFTRVCNRTNEHITFVFPTF